MGREEERGQKQGELFYIGEPQAREARRGNSLGPKWGVGKQLLSLLSLLQSRQNGFAYDRLFWISPATISGGRGWAGGHPRISSPSVTIYSGSIVRPIIDWFSTNPIERKRWQNQSYSAVDKARPFLQLQVLNIKSQPLSPSWYTGVLIVACS